MVAQAMAALARVHTYIQVGVIEADTLKGLYKGRRQQSNEAAYIQPQGGSPSTSEAVRYYGDNQDKGASPRAMQSRLHGVSMT
jgi:hypothetical protein